MIAVLGPSGAGKTSFLNVIARRVKNSKTKHITGSITINGQVASHKFFKKISGFVAQDDILMGSMTVWEALIFTATLTDAGKETKQQIEDRVRGLLESMGLMHVRDNFIGFVGKGSNMSGIARGLSGGERKRVSVCVELIHNPLLLFLDEPTSGLDSYAAKTVLNCLRGLSNQGRTVLCTIHQPSAEILKMFDKLLLLGSGSTVYFGPTNEAPQYFASIGHPLPKFCNPGDHYMTIIQTGGKEKIVSEEDIQEDSIVSLKDNITDHTALADAFLDSKYGKMCEAIEVRTMEEKKHLEKDCFGREVIVEEDDLEGERAPFLMQLKLLTKRAWDNVIREPLLFKTRIFQTIFISVLTGLIFLRIPYNLTGASDRISGGFFVALSPLFSSINGPTATFPPERGVFWRENGSGLYSTAAYFVSKLIAETPINFLSPIIFSTITYWLMGLNPSGVNFLIFLLIEIILSNVGYGMGLVMTLCIYDPAIVQRVQPLILLPLMIFAGFFINTNTIPKWLIWLEAISPMKYTFRAIMNVILYDLQFYCEKNDLREITLLPAMWNTTTDPSLQIFNSTGAAMICPVTEGSQLLAQLAMLPENWSYWYDVIILTGFGVFFYVLSYVLLVCRKPLF
uniref:ABC transporter domain-containing protein n=1 Tax=Arcella intermedia TaxID=1963864 RepID=A0A6B2KZL6_9EUKA